MKSFKDTSIQRKLLFILLLTSLIAVLLACVAFVANDFVSLKKQEVLKLQILADVIAHNTEAALAFDDSKSAVENLSALSAEPSIDLARIYKPEGRLFAEYRRAPVHQAAELPPPQAEGYFFRRNKLHLFHSVILDAEEIGIVYIQFDLGGFRSLIQYRIGIVFLILFSVFFIAFYLSTKLQRIISRPILQLADMAHTISRDKNYSIRITKKRGDELGALMDGFNTMLDQIQARDAELQNRALELSKANEELKKEIHERKLAQEQLLQSQKMQTIGTLAGGIAHDLNNQLTPVAGYIDFVLGQTDPKSFNYQLLKMINQAAKRCSDIVQRLTHFTRPSTQKKFYLKIDTILDEIKTFFPKFLPATIMTGVRCDGELWPVYVNETEVGTVLMNLVTNARDAMPGGGTLTIAAKNVRLGPEAAKRGRSPGAYVMISVSDSGVGMPGEVIPRIFEPFFTTKAVGKGTGLGLTMVFNIVKDHEGWVDVSSEIGKGSTFQIYLPAYPSQTIASEGKEGVEAEMPRGTETILYADDEEELRNMGKIFLEHLGYQPIVVSNGEEAVRIYQARGRQIAAVILDMTMPKVTGKEAFKRILEINPKAKIILMSGYTSEGDPSELMKEGVCEFLPKPFTIRPLAHAIRRVIEMENPHPL